MIIDEIHLSLLPGHKVPLVDIVFALSATAAASNTNFKQMKTVINSIIDHYGRGRILYSVVVYGKDSQIQVKFTEQFITDERLKNYILSMSPKTGGSNVLEAFQDGKRLFESGGARPGAHKVFCQTCLC